MQAHLVEFAPSAGLILLTAFRHVNRTVLPEDALGFRNGVHPDFGSHKCSAASDVFGADVSIPLWHSGFGERAMIPPAAPQLRRRYRAGCCGDEPSSCNYRGHPWDGHYAKTRQKSPCSPDSRSGLSGSVFAGTQ
ncbi:MAG: hypothetical protein E5W86_17435 [Mesorhizobium sp.]|nr:MAG: hypothetical protein E5W86_17435 [Mesorhizobium sp.]